MTAANTELPWGTFARVAKRIGTSRANVEQGWKEERPNIVDAVHEYIEEWNAQREETKAKIEKVKLILQTA